ncbi:hypothetical protein M5K25_021381 [Dendrobium thyrsiflorum]|uniref:Trafficking protein particle complex subunit n=1 Tax=Dendrobium thyrsiflorum TaxID=117978 RepID=A0ABD0UJ75_DENTH
MGRRLRILQVGIYAIFVLRNNGKQPTAGDSKRSREAAMGREIFLTRFRRNAPNDYFITFYEAKQRAFSYVLFHDPFITFALMQLILVTHPKTGDLRDALRYMYNLYVEYVVKNPLYVPGSPIKYANHFILYAIR